MRILLTSDTFTPATNGVVTSLVNLREGLRKLGHEVKVLTLSESYRTRYEDGVWYLKSIDFGAVYPGARIRNTQGKRAVRDLISWKPDIVHSQSEFSTFTLARKIAQSVDAPLVHTYHTLYEDYTTYFSPNRKTGRLMAQKFTKHILSRTEAAIAPTTKISSLLLSYGIKTPIHVIPTGLDLQRFSADNRSDDTSLLRARYGIDEKDFVILFIGRLAKEKNIEELISFFPSDRPDVKLLLVGDGPDRLQLEMDVREKGLRERVIFAGNQAQKDIPAFYRMGDLFSSASTSETQGLTYIEAMASSLPVLCRADRCLDDIVDEGSNGWQYRSAEEYRSAFEKFYHDRELREQMAAQALQTSVTFSRETFALSVEELYRHVLHSRSFRVRSA